VEDDEMCSYKEARRRLVAKYYSAVAELPPGKTPLFGIEHFLSQENIEAVARLDLYRDYADERRDRELVQAWLRRDDGRRQ
jgi:hypothetical protein